MTTKPEVSVIVPMTKRHDDVISLYREYRAGIEDTGRSFEFVYVLETHFEEQRADLERLRSEGEPIRLVVLAKSYGEGTLLSAGFAYSSGDLILILPAFRQIETSEIGPILEAAFGSAHMVVGRRYPRRGSSFNKISSKIFHMLLRSMLEFPFRDLGCSVRAFKRDMLTELRIFGDHHLFLPLIAHIQGFKVIEHDAAQAKADTRTRIYSAKMYIQRILDILTIIFLARFMRKPLRFFGLVGSVTLTVGGAATLWLIIERLFFGVPLADRPALVLATLMVVLGIQLLAVGLIGELIIFVHARDVKEYMISEIVERPSESTVTESSADEGATLTRLPQKDAV